MVYVFKEFIYTNDNYITNISKSKIVFIFIF